MLRVERYLLNAMPLCGAVTKLTGSRLGSAGPAPARAARARCRSAHRPLHRGGASERAGARHPRAGVGRPTPARRRRRHRRRYRLRRASARRSASRARRRAQSFTSPKAAFRSLSLPLTLATGPPTSRRRRFSSLFPEKSCARQRPSLSLARHLCARAGAE